MIKKFVQHKVKDLAHVEMNEIEIYLNLNGEKMQALKNKDTIKDLIAKGHLR